MFANLAGSAVTVVPFRQEGTDGSEALIRKTSNRVHHRQGDECPEQAINCARWKRLPDSPEGLDSLICLPLLVDNVQLVHENIQGDTIRFRVEVVSANIHAQKFSAMIPLQIMIDLPGADRA